MKFKLADGTEIEVPDDAQLEGGLKVAGAEVPVTAADLARSASKAEGADARFREAASTAAKAAPGIRLQELLSRTDPLTENELIELGTLTGRSAEEIGQSVAFYQQAMAAQAEDPFAAAPAQTPGGQQQQAAAGQGGEVNPAMQQMMAANQQLVNKVGALEQQLQQTTGLVQSQDGFLTEQASEKVDSTIMANLLSHGTLGKLNVDQQKALAPLIRGAVADRMNATGEAFGPAAINHGLEHAVGIIKGLGIQTQEAEKAHNLQAAIDREGLQAGLGPSANGSAVPTQVTVNTEIPRVPANDPNYAENFAVRVLQDEAAGRLPTSE